MKIDESFTPNINLGSGGFGCVIVCTMQWTTAAVKLAKRNNNNDAMNKDGLPELANELRMFRQERHPIIVVFCGTCFDSLHGQLILVLERALGNSLQVLMEGLF